jgi:hypothetical protein
MTNDYGSDSIADKVKKARRDRAKAKPRQPTNGAAQPSQDDPPELLSDDAIEETIKHLARLSPVAYEHQRDGAAKKCGMRASVLDKLVKHERDDNGGPPGQGRPVEIIDVEPWGNPVDGASLLQELSDYFDHHAHLPDKAEHALALWTAHTWMFDAWRRTPRLNLRSLVRGSGKTTVIELLVPVVRRGKSVDNLTAPVVFRLVELMAPTLLLDEADRILDEKNNRELIGLLDSGHERGKEATRCVGENFILRDFSAHSPAVLAGLGRLPGTLDDRSIIIRMEKMKRDEQKTPITDASEMQAARLARQAARWVADNRQALASADPDMGSLFARPADLWRPLFAIADLAGSDWPALARDAQQALAADDDDDAKPLPIRLLADIRDVMKEVFEVAVDAGGDPPSEFNSQALVDRLVGLPGRPWAEMKGGKPLTTNRLARLLRGFRILPDRIGPEHERTRGYLFSAFDDAFARHLA